MVGETIYYKREASYDEKTFPLYGLFTTNVVRRER